jgi:diguanylate cyclase (GGDEF)-like protein/PAS domain S-box-containing protein
MVYRKNPSNFGELRELAQQRLPERLRSSTTALTVSEAQQLFAELEIHQIELEMQNEHLNVARTQLETALRRSAELYDFAPVGFFSLDSNGGIAKLNLAGANLLEEERTGLLGRKFADHVIDADRLLLDGWMNLATQSGDLQSGELSLTNRELLIKQVEIRIAPLPAGAGWQLVLLDITERKLLEVRLQSDEARWRLALDAAGDGVWDWNVQTGEMRVSRRLKSLYGYAEDAGEADLSEWTARIHPDDKPRVMARMRAYLEGLTPNYSNEYRGQNKDGSWRWVYSRGAIIGRTEDGKPFRIIGTLVDITDRKDAELSLHVSAQFQQAVFDSLSAHVVVLDRRGIVVQTNAAWRKYALEHGFMDLNWQRNGNYLDMLRHLTGHDQQIVQQARAGMAVVASGGSDFTLADPFFEPVGKRWFSMKVTPVGDAEGRIVVSHEDVTAIKSAELASLALANTDALTGALSRRNFLNLAEQELSRARRYQLQLMVLMLDLDYFKQINDQHGHAGGDAVLQSFVQTVNGVLRESDLLGRLGGEEFMVLLPNTTQEGGYALAQRIIESVRASPVHLAGKRIAYTVSVGGACLSTESSFIDLLKVADNALYRAKNSGRDRLEMGHQLT